MNVTINFYGADEPLTHYLIEFIRTNCHKAKIDTHKWVAPADIYDVNVIIPEEYNPSLILGMNRELVVFNESEEMKILKFAPSHYTHINID